MQDKHDVVIAGASLAGCTAAILFARRGLRVALVERHSNSAHYKKLCTHYIQSSATTTLQRLGLAQKIEAAGGVRNSSDVWTAAWGWQRDAGVPAPYFPYGYNIRREVLDPLLRDEAKSTPNVDFMAGTTAEQLIEEGGRICGLVVNGGESGRRKLKARLVVAADGRHSTLAGMAGVPTQRKPHNRLGYFAHYRGLKFPEASRSKLWFSMPDVAYAFANDAATMVVVCMPHKSRQAEWKADPEASLVRHFARLPEAPDLGAAERVTPVFAIADLTNVARRAAHRGMVLIGDAAQASDPLWGVGCGWALQTGEWLVDCTADALLGQGDLDAAIDRYRRLHRSRLAGHEFLTSDFATGRPFNLIEKLIFSAAARDRIVAQHVNLFAQRHIGALRFLSPAMMLRAIWVNLRFLLGSVKTASPQSA